MSLIKLFLAGNTYFWNSRFFWNLSILIWEKPSLRQKQSRPGKVNPPQEEVFPARKSKPSSGRSIPGQEK
jgi:hypothetical protein